MLRRFPPPISGRRVVRVGGFPPPRHPQSTHPVDETGRERRIQLPELGAGVAAATHTHPLTGRQPLPETTQRPIGPA